MSQRLLLLIENPDLGDVLRLALRQYEADLFSRPEPAADAFRRSSYDLGLIDVSLVGHPSGLDVLRQWRAAGCSFPLIALSDLPQPSLAAEALDAGADDFLRKPFHHEELLGRIRKLLRRAPAAPMRKAGGVVIGSEPFIFAGVTVTPDLTLRFPLGETERIRPKEHGILKHFCENAGGLVLKEELLRAVWGSDSNETGRSVNVYLSRLRKLYQSHRIDLNRFVESEPKAGWRIRAEAAAGRPDTDS